MDLPDLLWRILLAWVLLFGLWRMRYYLLDAMFRPRLPRYEDYDEEGKRAKWRK